MSKTEKTEEKKEPRVEVGTMQFVQAYDGPGIQGSASSLSSKHVRRESRHTILWFPRLRVFEITHQPRDADYAEVDMVPDTSVRRWRRLSDCLALVR